MGRKLIKSCLLLADYTDSYLSCLEGVGGLRSKKIQVGEKKKAFDSIFFFLRQSAGISVFSSELRL